MIFYDIEVVRMYAKRVPSERCSFFVCLRQHRASFFINDQAAFIGEFGDGFGVIIESALQITSGFCGTCEVISGLGNFAPIQHINIQ